MHVKHICPSAVPSSIVASFSAISVSTVAQISRFVLEYPLKAGRVAMYNPNCSDVVGVSHTTCC